MDGILSDLIVFKVKPGYIGVAERYKARLVAEGFTQQYGTDYN